FVPILDLDEMDRPAADDAHDVTGASEKEHALAHQHLIVPSPDARDVEIAIVVDVRDDQADLIDVPGEHDGRRTLCVHGGDANPDGPGVSRSCLRKATES